MDVRFAPVTKDSWPDLEALFESRGGPHCCWCMAWRTNEFKQSRPGKIGKKASLKRRVDDAVPVGLLAYAEKRPVGWCSVAPRETFKPLGGDETLTGVWSIVCLFIQRQYRKRGLTSQLINAAIGHAKENGAQYVEAYPVDPDSPSYRFMGFRSLFEEAGFRLIKKTGARRRVMVLAIS